MKFFTGFFVGVFAVGLGVRLIAQTTEPTSLPSPATQPAATAVSYEGFSEQQILQTWGWILAHARRIDHSEISDAEWPDFQKGMTEGFRGDVCPYYYEKIMPDVQNLAKARRAKFVQFLTDKNRAAANAFFAELDNDPNVVKLPSGLRYKIIRPGVGPCPTPKQTVSVHFLGHLLDGTEFTQSGPVDSVLWPSRFNSYVYEGVQKINKGGL